MLLDLERICSEAGRPLRRSPELLFDYEDGQVDGLLVPKEKKPKAIVVPEHIARDLERSRETSGPFGPRLGNNNWQEVIFRTIADNTQVLNSTTETPVVEAALVPTLPTRYLTVGRVLKWFVWGRVSTVVTTPGTITFRLRMGGTAGTPPTGTTLLTSKAQRPKVTVSTNMAAWFEMVSVCRAEGVAGSIFSMGQCQLANSIGDAAAVGESIWPDAPAAVTADTTVASLFTPSINFSVATATTAWTSHIARLEALN